MLLMSCSKDVDPQLKTIIKSLKTWGAFKRSSSNSYKFIVQQNTFSYIGNVRTETIVNPKKHVSCP